MRKWPSSDGAINHPPAIEAEKVRALRTPFAHVHEKAPVGFLQPDFFSGVLDHSFLAGDWFERKNAASRNARFFHTQRVGAETRIDVRFIRGGHDCAKNNFATCFSTAIRR